MQGLGCWSGNTAEEHESAKPWLLSALQIGYRHFDTAHGYGTEGVVGRAIRESGIPREQIHVTTKLPYVILVSALPNKRESCFDVVVKDQNITTKLLLRTKNHSSEHNLNIMIL